MNALDSAIDDYSRVLKLDPNHVRAEYQRGACQNMKGDFAGAIQDYVNALEKDQEKTTAMHQQNGSFSPSSGPTSAAKLNKHRSISAQQQQQHQHQRKQHQDSHEQQQGALQQQRVAVVDSPSSSSATSRVISTPSMRMTGDAKQKRRMAEDMLTSPQVPHTVMSRKQISAKDGLGPRFVSRGADSPSSAPFGTPSRMRNAPAYSTPTATSSSSSGSAAAINGSIYNMTSPKVDSPAGLPRQRSSSLVKGGGAGGGSTAKRASASGLRTPSSLSKSSLPPESMTDLDATQSGYQHVETTPPFTRGNETTDDTVKY